MRNSKRLYGFLIALLVAIPTLGWGFPPDSVAVGSIASLSIAPVGKPLAPPIATLVGGQLHISFDWIGQDAPLLAAQLVHCGPDWMPSALQPYDFLYADGECRLESQPSVAIANRYTHYSLALPNQQLRPRLSGNYLLRIYAPYEQGRIYIIAHVAFCEEDLQQGIAIDTRYRATAAPRDLVSIAVSSDYAAPGQDIQVYAQQDWPTPDGHLLRASPSRGAKGEVKYGSTNTFRGNGEWALPNEWRTFDTRTLTAPLYGIDRASHLEGEWHLRVEQCIPYDPRTRLPDNGGLPLFGRTDGGASSFASPGNTSVYAWVYFSLRATSNYAPPMDALDGLAPGSQPLLFVPGAPGGDAGIPMEFSAESGLWETRLYLKQGLYNYRYGYRRADGRVLPWGLEPPSPQGDPEYHVLVYRQRFGERYHRLELYSHSKPH